MSAEMSGILDKAPEWYEIALPAGVVAVKSASGDIGDIEVALKQGLSGSFTRTTKNGILHNVTFGEIFDIDNPNSLVDGQVRPMTDRLDKIRTQNMKEDTAIMFVAHEVTR